MSKRRKPHKASKAKASQFNHALAAQLQHVKSVHSAPAPQTTTTEAKAASKAKAVSKTKAASKDIDALTVEDFLKPREEGSTAPQAKPTREKHRRRLERLQQAHQALAQETQAQAQRHEEELHDLHQKLASAQDEIASLQKTLRVSQQKEAQAETRAQKFLEERETMRQAYDAQRQQKRCEQSLASLLTQRGLSPNDWGQALTLLLAQHPMQQCDTLYTTDVGAWTKSLAQKIRLWCGDSICASHFHATHPRAKLLQIGEAKRCDNCAGSDTRRAFNALAQTCLEQSRYRWLIVGGSPESHAEIQALCPDKLKIQLVDGKKRRDKQQARDDLRTADLVIIWGPSILTHKVSELYTKQRDKHPNKIYIATKRGLSAMTQEIRAALQH